MEEATDQDVRLAEYAALRAEIAQRSSFQQALVALNLTAVATIVGFVLTKHSSKSLLLLVPLISSTLGLLWLDHHRNIRLIGTYTRRELWIWKPSWETWFASRRVPAAEFVYGVSILIIYGAASVVTLVVSWPNASAELGVELLTGAGVILAALFLSAYAVVVVFPLLKGHSDE